MVSLYSFSKTNIMIDKTGLPKNVDVILQKIGLSVSMTTDKSSPDYKDLLNLKTIAFYKPKWLRENTQLQEMDEVYRLTTNVLLDIDSGIRCEYTIYESYEGEEEYKLIRIFVTTLENEKMALVNCDFDQRYVETEKGLLSFDQLKKVIDAED